MTNKMFFGSKSDKVGLIVCSAKAFGYDMMSLNITLNNPCFGRSNNLKVSFGVFVL